MRSAFTLALGAVLLAWSVVACFIEAVSQPYRIAAERIEAGAAADAAYFLEASGNLAKSDMLSLCTRDMVRSAASIRLADVDAALKKLDTALSADALAKARATLRGGLHCFPYNGNLWLRLAMVEVARGGSKDDIARMLALSSQTAPREAWVLLPRLAFAATVSDLNLAAVSDVVQGDVETLVRSAEIVDVKGIYDRSGASVRALILEAVSKLEAGRREELERALKS